MNELDRIRANVLAEARTAPSSPSWWVQAFGLIGLNAAAVAVALAAAALFELGPIELRWTNLLFALTVVSAVVGGIRPRAGGTLVLAGGLALLSVVSHVVLAAARGSGHAWIVEPSCALAEVGVSLVPLAATLWALSRFHYRPSIAFVGGVGAAGSGMLVLDATCHVPGAFHPVAFHLLPMVALAVLFVWVRARTPTHATVP